MVVYLKADEILTVRADIPTQGMMHLEVEGIGSPKEATLVNPEMPRERFFVIRITPTIRGG